MMREKHIERRRLGSLLHKRAERQPREPFRERVYAVVKRIPRGKVASYGMVALLAGKIGAARAVGRLMADVPRVLRLPCHRVIRSDGGLAAKEIFDGKQGSMLKREGVLFRKNGRVDMQRCEWEGD